MDTILALLAMRTVRGVQVLSTLDRFSQMGRLAKWDWKTRDSPAQDENADRERMDQLAGDNNA